MNQLQKKEFELLKCFIEICEELQLTYYLVCGSALGAVKYGGFIPWDDDIDVGMPREDYQIFLNQAPAMLPKQFFLQNSESDPVFPMLYSKLRNSETTYIEKSAVSLPMNHGIFIDIFPLDGYPTKQREQKILEFKKKICLLQISCVFTAQRRIRGQVVVDFFRLLGCHKRTNKIIRYLNGCLSAYSIKDSSLICNHGNWQGRLEYAPKEQYGKGLFVSFEGLDVRVPENFDEYLTQKYGEWRKDLPKEEQKGHHTFTICDVEKPYTEYMNGGQQ